MGPHQYAAQGQSGQPLDYMYGRPPFNPMQQTMMDPSQQHEPEMRKHLDELNDKFEAIRSEIDKTSKDLNDFKQQ